MNAYDNPGSEGPPRPLDETLFWQAQPGIAEDLAEASTDAATGRALGEDELRVKFDVPRHR